MNSNITKKVAKSKTEAKKSNSTTETPRMTMTDASTQARRISTLTVSDDIDELYARWMKELNVIKTLKARLKMISEDESRRLKEIKELEEKQRIELNRRKMKVLEEQAAKEKEKRKQEWLADIKAKANAAKKEKEVEVLKAKKAEDLKIEVAKKVKAQKDQRVRNALKRKLENEKENETQENWKKDFGFKKPKVIPRVYKVPGSPITYYRKPYVTTKDSSRLCNTIIISDDEFTQKPAERTPILERLGKKVAGVSIPSNRKVPVKDLNFYKKVVESSSESESETESDNSDKYEEIETMSRINIVPVSQFRVDIDASTPGTSAKPISPINDKDMQDDAEYWAKFIYDCEKNPML